MSSGITTTATAGASRRHPRRRPVPGAGHLRPRHLRRCIAGGCPLRSPLRPRLHRRRRHRIIATTGIGGNGNPTSLGFTAGADFLCGFPAKIVLFTPLIYYAGLRYYIVPQEWSLCRAA